MEKRNYGQTTEDQKKNKGSNTGTTGSSTSTPGSSKQQPGSQNQSSNQQSGGNQDQQSGGNQKYNSGTQPGSGTMGQAHERPQPSGTDQDREYNDKKKGFNEGNKSDNLSDDEDRDGTGTQGSTGTEDRSRS